MEIPELVIISGLLIFLAVIGYACLKKYTQSELEKSRLQGMDRIKTELNEYREENHKLRNMRDVYKSKLNILKQQGLDFDDYYYDPNSDEETRISDIVHTIFPQLPKEFVQLADRQDVQEMITKIATKNPDKILNFIDNFSNKDKKENSNKQKEITQLYG